MSSLLSILEGVNEAPAKAGAFYGKLANPVKTGQSDLNKAAEAILKAGEKYKINPAYLWGIFGVETSYGSQINTSSTGAKGPFQFEPATAKAYGYPTGINEKGNLSTVNWSAFEKQADAAAHFLAAHGGTKNIQAAVKAYNPGEQSYLQKVIEHAKSFSASFGSEAANKQETATTEEAKPEKGTGLLEQAEKFLSGFALTTVLVLAAAVLVIYGIMVAVRPRENALSIPVPALV